MDTLAPSMRDLARRLLTLEAESPPAPAAHAHEAVRVCEKLRISLTRFAGAAGFAALLRRALALARSDVPALQTVKVSADGRLEGLEEFAADAQDAASEAAIEMTAHLLGLLATFIGESLMLSLVRETWPEASLEESL